MTCSNLLTASPCRCVRSRIGIGSVRLVSLPISNVVPVLPNVVPLSSNVVSSGMPVTLIFAPVESAVISISLLKLLLAAPSVVMFVVSER